LHELPRIPKNGAKNGATHLIWHPHSKPNTIKESPRPLCHANCPKVRQAFKEKYRAFVDAYREAVKRLKMGAILFTFPRYAYPPPLPNLLLAA